MSNVSSTASDVAILGAGSYVNSTLHTIATSSITDISSEIQVDGSVNVTAPTIDGAVAYYLLAAYYSKSYTRACVASNSEPKDILQNGSFAVDHFSPVGAQLTTSFLEQYILIDGIDELIREVGNYIWEDSVEIPSFVYWTPNLTSVFREQHGVSQGPPLRQHSGQIDS